MNNIDTSDLITDRTDADSYEAVDLNRVGETCIKIVSAAVEEAKNIENLRPLLGVEKNDYTRHDYVIPSVDAKTDFAIDETYTTEQMRQYLQNVENIVNSFPPKELKKLPSSMRLLFSEGANNIEDDLKQSAENLVKRANLTEQNITNTADAFAYGGEMNAGGLF